MSTSTLKDQIKSDMIAAMRAKDADTLRVIRMLQAGIKQKEVDGRIELDETGILAVIEKMIKQGRESIKQFELGNRADLATKEAQEIAVLQKYLPKQLSAPEIEEMITYAIKETGAKGMADMGKVMGMLKAELQGRADMAEVSAKIKSLLS